MRSVIKSILIVGCVLGFVNAKEVGKVNGMSITEGDVNSALKVLTQGKKQWSNLDANEKKEIIQMVAPSKVIAAKAKKTLSKDEKESALANYWLQKQIQKVSVSDSEVKAKYAQMMDLLKKSGSSKKAPSIEEATPTLKVQIAKEKVVGKLMKKASIKLKN